MTKEIIYIMYILFSYLSLFNYVIASNLIVMMLILKRYHTWQSFTESDLITIVFK